MYKSLLNQSSGISVCRMQVLLYRSMAICAGIYIKVRIYRNGAVSIGISKYCI